MKTLITIIIAATIGMAVQAQTFTDWPSDFTIEQGYGNVCQDGLFEGTSQQVYSVGNWCIATDFPIPYSENKRRLTLTYISSSKVKVYVWANQMYGNVVATLPATSTPHTVTIKFFANMISSIWLYSPMTATNHAEWFQMDNFCIGGCVFPTNAVEIEGADVIVPVDVKRTGLGCYDVIGRRVR